MQCAPSSKYDSGPANLQTNVLGFARSRERKTRLSQALDLCRRKARSYLSVHRISANGVPGVNSQQQGVNSQQQDSLHTYHQASSENVKMTFCVKMTWNFEELTPTARKSGEKYATAMP